MFANNILQIFKGNFMVYYINHLLGIIQKIPLTTEL